MKTYSNPKVAEFMMDVQSVSGERFEIAEQIRELFLKCEPDLTEEIKYGGLVFFREKELVSGVFFYKDHMSIEFGQGVNMPDPDSVLEGKGKFRRHIKIRGMDDMRAINIAGYVKESLR